MVKERQLVIGEARVHCLEAGNKKDPDILFLHGMKFSSQTWHDLGTLGFFESKGFHPLAVDLPGFGKSDALSMESAAILLTLINDLELTKPFLVVPSFSGGYCLPVIAEELTPLSGFVAVAPTNIPDYAKRLKGNPLPSLAIWGGNDEIVPIENADLLCKCMTNIRKVVFKDAGHPCYLEETDSFHRELLEFFSSVS